MQCIFFKKSIIWERKRWRVTFVQTLRFTRFTQKLHIEDLDYIIIDKQKREHKTELDDLEVKIERHKKNVEGISIRLTLLDDKINEQKTEMLQTINDIKVTIETRIQKLEEAQAAAEAAAKVDRDDIAQIKTHI